MLDTIRSSADISRAFTHGKRLSGSLVTVLICKTPEGHGPRGRVAFIAGKKHGGAVWRNQAKRRLRAVAREAGAPWPGYDVVFIAKPATTDQLYSKVLQQTRSLLRDGLGE